MSPAADHSGTPVGAVPLASPCINLCVMDSPSGWCTGCGRTIDEIAFWTSGSAAWRSEVMAALPDRLAALPPR